MSTVPEQHQWVVCPVCHKANPAGTHFCKFCWGAAIPSQVPIPDSEIGGVLKSIESQKKRRRLIFRVIIPVSILTVLALIVIPLLYSYTDAFTPLSQQFNSNSKLGEWSMFRHDEFNSGAVAGSSVPTGVVKWKFDTGDAIHSSVAVVNGTVYFGSRNGKLYALDAETGAERWEFQTGSRVESSPAVADGMVFFGSNDGFFYALNAQTGEQAWKFPTKYPVASSPAVANGMVFFGADDYSVYALREKDGAKVWQFKTPGPVESSPVVVDGMVYVGCGVDWTYVLNASNGRPRLHFKMYEATYGSPAVSGDTVVVGNFRGDLYFFRGGARNWPLEYELRPMWIQVWAMGLAPKPPAQSGFLWALRLGGAISSSPAISGQTVYVGADGKMVAVDMVAHRIAWNFPTGGLIKSSPAVVGSTVLFGSDDGNLYAVDSGGKEVWKFKTGGPITASPTVADGVVYIGSHDGNLYAIE